MATLEQVANRVLAAIESTPERPIGVELAGQWVSDRYAQLVSRVRMRHRRRIGTITTPATINTGLVSAVRGSTSVTADADAQAVLSSAVEGRHIRIANTWYEIADYTAPTITLATAYGEEDVDDHGYSIVKRFHETAADARWFGRVVCMRQRRMLEWRPYESFDRTQPDRIFATEGPTFVAEAQNSADGIKQLEFYPYSSEIETIYYVYWPAPDLFALTDDLPREVDPYVLREGALIDAFRYRASQEANGNRIEAAAYWRNESRAQETRWEQIIMEATRADRGVDDVSFILNWLSLSNDLGRDIRTAFDQVWLSERG